MAGVLFLLWLGAPFSGIPGLQKARDGQDRVTLVRLASQLTAEADRRLNDAEAQYRAALAQSTLGEVAAEVRDRDQARVAAEAGMKAAERAVGLQPGQAEFHRILGTLCGQAAAAVAGLAALPHGRCALSQVNQALELDPKSALNHLSRGIGNYYLPALLGGGVDRAIQDFEKAIELDPRSADAHLWLGIALNKANRTAEARRAFEKSLTLNPARLWARQQLEKTRAK